MLVTAGPTREEIDPIRYITNYSSGKMGYAIARAASQAGAETVLISGPTNLKPPSDVKIIRITTTDELRKEVLNEFAKVDCLIMAAAPADYRPVTKENKKIKRTDKKLKIELSPTDDILKEIAKIKNKKQLTIGFALETDKGIANAKRKLREKGLDLIILNKPGKDSGFNSDTNVVTIISPDRRPVKWPLESKREIANKLLEIISEML